MMEDNAPFLELPNNMKTDACHNNLSHRAPPYKPGPTNSAAKRVDSARVMNEVLNAR